jgi:hypothetical protein
MVDQDIVNELLALDETINLEVYARIRAAKIVADAIIRNGYSRSPSGGGAPAFPGGPWPITCDNIPYGGRGETIN